jgi:hypothetical protein
MLIEHYDLKVFTPPCDPEAERFAAFAELAVDISEVRPYLNATLLHHLLAADTPEDFNAR